MWAPLLIIVIICACVVLGVQFDMPVGMSLLSVFLAFFFSLLAIQCAGVTGEYSLPLCNEETLVDRVRTSLLLPPRPRHLNLSSVVRQRASTGCQPTPNNSIYWVVLSPVWAPIKPLI